VVQSSPAIIKKKKIGLLQRQVLKNQEIIMGLKKNSSKGTIQKSRAVSQPHKFNSVNAKIDPLSKRVTSLKVSAPRSTTMKMSSSSKNFQPLGVPRA
jgi:hypothetical protein